jgi:hypothetical protein
LEVAFSHYYKKGAFFVFIYFVESTCAGAAARGALEMLQWALADGGEWDERLCLEAAKAGQLEVLQWADGHLEVLRWAHDTCNC